MKLLISQNRTLRIAALAILLLAALFTRDTGARLSAVDNTPTKVRLTVLNTCQNSGTPTTFSMKVGTANVGTVSGGTDCTCTPPLRVLESTNAAVLAQVGEPACTDLTVSMTGSTYIAWVRAEIVRNSGTETYCLTDTQGGSCNVNDLCSAGYADTANATWTAGPPRHRRRRPEQLHRRGHRQ